MTGSLVVPKVKVWAAKAYEQEVGRVIESRFEDRMSR